MKKRSIVVGLLLLPVVAGGWVITDRVAFDRAAWQQDYEQLKHETTLHYANLKWSASVKGVDLVALDQRTEQALRAAHSRREARRALEKFVGSFQDAHFRIERRPPRIVAALLQRFQARESDLAIDFAMSAQEACGAFGFADRRPALALEHAALAEQHATTFAAGILTLPDGRKYGIIGIPRFAQWDYAAACERTWQSYRSAATVACDEDCQSYFLHLVKRELAAALAADARLLARTATAGVIVDLTDNGGGTEWAEYAAAALAPRPLRPPTEAFVRGEHWSQNFSTDLEQLAKELQSERSDSGRARMRQADVRLRALHDSARTSCDLSPIWRQRNWVPSCWNVVIAPPKPQIAPELVQSRPYSGPLYVLVNGRTASAAEYFAGILQDNRVARVLGEKTMGVGCGHTNGGIQIRLKHSGLVIWTPDCARLRADGSNEFEGVQPDVPVTWGTDKSTKGSALYAALQQMSVN